MGQKVKKPKRKIDFLITKYSHTETTTVFLSTRYNIVYTVLVVFVVIICFYVVVAHSSSNWQNLYGHEVVVGRSARSLHSAP